MWTAYYEEWKRHKGQPSGYGSENQVEPWLSDEVFNELVDAEIDLWGRSKTNMGFISRKLVEKVSSTGKPELTEVWSLFRGVLEATWTESAERHPFPRSRRRDRPTWHSRDSLAHSSFPASPFNSA